MLQSAPQKIPSIDYRPAQYSELLEQKAAAITQLLADFAPPPPEVFDSPKQHFRMRTEFRIWHDKQAVGAEIHDIDDSADNDTCHYVMFEPEQPRVPVKIVDFPIASKAITAIMTPLLANINNDKTLKHKLFQVEFLSTTTGQILVSLIYHRQLDEEWKQAAKALEQRLNIFVIGRARKQQVVLSQDFVVEQLTVNGSTLTYHQQENSFTQPNAAINSKMIEWLSDKLSNSHRRSPSGRRDLLELYCGNGNFTIPLSRHFNNVLATEISKSSIRLASKNCEANQVNNIEFIRLSSDETAAALNQEREFRRLQHIDINDYDFSTVLVDPPRAGLDSRTLALVASFDTIIYISCNPNTLADNIQTLSSSHSIAQLALFDQFPYTHHCECGLILQRKA